MSHHSKSREYRDTVKAILAENGIKDMQFGYTRKASCVTFKARGKDYHFYFPITPSDSYRGVKNSACSLRKKIKQIYA